ALVSALRQRPIMRKLSVLILSLLLFPAIASAESEGPPPPSDSQDVKMAQPPDAEPGMQPPAPPAAPPSPASDSDQVGIVQQPAPASTTASVASQKSNDNKQTASSLEDTSANELAGNMAHTLAAALSPTAPASHRAAVTGYNRATRVQARA